VPFTLILGGVLSVPALLFVHASPQSAWVRHFAAICQIGWSAVFLWLLEGRPEAQFHLFVSMVFIAFYREWPVVMTATVVALAYPVARLMMLPESYAVSASAWWHILDQGVWVIVEAAVLLFTVHQTHRTVDRFAADLQLEHRIEDSYSKPRPRLLDSHIHLAELHIEIVPQCHLDCLAKGKPLDLSPGKIEPARQLFGTGRCGSQEEYDTAESFEHRIGRGAL